MRTNTRSVSRLSRSYLISTIGTADRREVHSRSKQSLNSLSVKRARLVNPPRRSTSSSSSSSTGRTELGRAAPGKASSLSMASLTYCSHPVDIGASCIGSWITSRLSRDLLSAAAARRYKYQLIYCDCVPQKLFRHSCNSLINCPLTTDWDLAERVNR